MPVIYYSKNEDDHTIEVHVVDIREVHSWYRYALAIREATGIWVWVLD